MATKEYNESHREILRKKCREYYAKNREKCRAANSEYYRIHKEECNERSKVWYEQNKEAFLFKCREYRLKNLESKRYKDREYYRLHRDEVKAQAREYGAKHRKERKAYRIKNRERLNLQTRLWHHNVGPARYRINLESNRVASRERMAKRRVLVGVVTPQMLEEVKARNIENYGVLTCYLCRLPIVGEQGNLEHKVPVCRGGRHELVNMDMAHGSCNRSKGRLTYAEFMDRKMAL